MSSNAGFGKQDLIPDDQELDAGWFEGGEFGENDFGTEPKFKKCDVCGKADKNVMRCGLKNSPQWRHPECHTAKVKGETLPDIKSENVSVSPSLEEHIAAINGNLDRMRQHGRETILAALEIGQRLTECKRQIEHGAWLPFLHDNFAWTERSAQNYMNLVKIQENGRLCEGCTTIADLGLALSSLYFLASPNVPVAAVNAVKTRLQHGETPTAQEVKHEIQKAKEAETPKRKTVSDFANGYPPEQPKPDPEELEIQAIIDYLHGRKRQDLVIKAIRRLLNDGWLKLADVMHQ